MFNDIPPAYVGNHITFASTTPPGLTENDLNALPNEDGVDFGVFEVIEVTPDYVVFPAINRLGDRVTYRAPHGTYEIIPF